MIIPILLGTVVSVFLCRLGFEFWLYFIDWLVSTKKAADKYNAEKENR
jgi:hypothetical protein